MNDIKLLLNELIGTQKTLSTNVLFIDYTGSHEAGIYLSQLFYWSGRTKIPGGWIAKKYDDWYEEIRVKEQSIRRFSKKFVKLGFLETKVKKYDGVPVLHYKLDRDKLIGSMLTFCKGRPLQIDRVDPDNLEGSLEPDNLEGSINRELHRVNTENTSIARRGEKNKITKEDIQDFENQLDAKKEKEKSSGQKEKEILPETQLDVKELIIQKELHYDTMSNRIAIFEIAKEYMKSEEFKSSWKFWTDRVPVGKIDPEEIIKDWVIKADWFVVKNFQINKITGWIQRAIRDIKNSPKYQQAKKSRDSYDPESFKDPKGNTNVKIIRY